jgi:hypothetical protein
MTQTRFAKGPDGATRGFYPGWKQERRLLRSIKAQQSAREQGVRPRPFPSPPHQPSHAQLDAMLPPQLPQLPPNMGVDPDTGEIFMLSDWDPQTAHAAQQAVAASAASAASAADMTAQLRAMLHTLTPPAARAVGAAPPPLTPPLACTTDAIALTNQLRSLHGVGRPLAAQPPFPRQQPQPQRPQPPAQTWQQQAQAEKQWQPVLPSQQLPAAAGNASSSLKLLLGVGRP